MICPQPRSPPRKSGPQATSWRYQWKWGTIWGNGLEYVRIWGTYITMKSQYIIYIMNMYIHLRDRILKDIMPLHQS